MLTKVRAEYVELMIKKRRLARLFGGSSYTNPPTMGAQFPRGAEIAIYGFLGNNSAPRGAPDPGEVSFDAETFWLQGVFGRVSIGSGRAEIWPFKVEVDHAKSLQADFSEMCAAIGEVKTYLLEDVLRYRSAKTKSLCDAREARYGRSKFWVTVAWCDKRNSAHRGATDVRLVSFER